MGSTSSNCTDVKQRIKLVSQFPRSKFMSRHRVPNPWHPARCSRPRFSPQGRWNQVPPTEVRDRLRYAFSGVGECPKTSALTTVRLGARRGTSPANCCSADRSGDRDDLEHAPTPPGKRRGRTIAGDGPPLVRAPDLRDGRGIAEPPGADGPALSRGLPLPRASQPGSRISQAWPTRAGSIPRSRRSASGIGTASPLTSRAMCRLDG